MVLEPDSYKVCDDLPEDFGLDAEKWERRIKGEMGKNNMYFSVEWEEGCTTTVDSQNAKRHLGGDHDDDKGVRATAFFHNWEKCKCTDHGDIIAQEYRQ